MWLSWFLALVLLMGQAEAQFCNKITLGTNLARGRPALQSSVLPHEFVPSAIKAVDGDCSADFGHGSCTHTQADNNPWWFVDLGTSYTVAAVVVYNRADCCDLRLQGAEVRVGDAMNASDHGRSNPLCGVIEKPNGSANTVRCKWLKGRYVSIHLPGQSAYLTLCEVEVYGLPAENQC